VLFATPLFGFIQRRDASVQPTKDPPSSRTDLTSVYSSPHRDWQSNCAVFEEYPFRTVFPAASTAMKPGRIYRSWSCLEGLVVGRRSILRNRDNEVHIVIGRVRHSIYTAADLFDNDLAPNQVVCVGRLDSLSSLSCL